MLHNDVCVELTCWLLDMSNNLSSSLMWRLTSFKRSLSLFPITWTFSLASKQSVPSAFTNSWQDMSCSEATLSWDSSSSCLICCVHNKKYFSKNFGNWREFHDAEWRTFNLVGNYTWAGCCAHTRKEAAVHGIRESGICVLILPLPKKHSRRPRKVSGLSFLIW